MLGPQKVNGPLSRGHFLETVQEGTRHKLIHHRISQQMHQVSLQLLFKRKDLKHHNKQQPKQGHPNKAESCADHEATPGKRAF